MSSRLVIALFALTFLGGLLAAINLASSIGQPFGGFLAGHSHSYDLWSVEASTPPWWPTIASGQLQYDDTLVAIDGQPYNYDADQYYEAAAESGRARLTYTLVRSNRPLTTEIPWRIFTFGNFLDLKFPDLINGIGFWLLAVTVFFAQPHNHVNRIFAVGMSLAAAAIWLSISGLFVEAPGLARLLGAFWIGTACFVGPTFVHLTIIYPDPIRSPLTRLIRFNYGLMAIVAVVYLIAYFNLSSYTPNIVAVSLLNICNVLVIGSFGLGVLAYLARLIYLLSRSNRSRRLHRQSAMLLLGAALALPYVVVVVMRSFIRSPQDYFAVGLDIRYLILAVPISFAFVILRYQTLQRIHPAVAAVFILATSALLASLITWLMRLLDPRSINLQESLFVPIFMASLITAAFYSLQNTLRGTFSKVFQWEFRSYTAVRKFMQQVVAQPHIDLPNVITQALVDKLELDCAAVWLWDAHDHQYELSGQSGKWPIAPPDRLHAATPPQDFVRPHRLDSDSEASFGWLNGLKRVGAVEIVAPLSLSGEPIGLLGLGKRWDEEIFDNRDLEIIELVAQQAALFILTDQQITRLQQVPQQITTAQERERFRLAQELHDTVQQFLGRLPFYLQVSRDKTRTDPAETENILQRCIVDVEDAAQAVRHIRSNLAPLQLESSLTASLGTLIANFRTRTGIEAVTDFSPEADNALPLETRHALYRVVQQALDNAAAHARATQVAVRLSSENGHLHFSIIDNGHGVTEPERQRAEAEGHFGLISMRARITALGGEFNFDSAPETGTQIRGWLPVG